MSTPLQTWHRVIAEKNSALLDEIVAADAVFHSPVVFTPQEGKAITVKYLAAANKVLNNGSFRYVGEWTAPNLAVLGFTAEVEGVTIDGADFVRWNDDGKICEFKVMIRPLKAINIVMQKMGEELARKPT